MKKFILLFLIVLSLIGFTSNTYAGYVNGYTRSNGTYVNGYYRTSPDSSPYNNYSYPGNYNPNTGSITGGNADTYLNNYYNKSSSSTYSSPYYDYSYSPISSCPLNSYSDGSGSCQCSYGYVVSGSSCVTGTSYCSNKVGIMSSYNSLSKTCECMSGYEYDGSSCKYKSTIPTYSCPLNSKISSIDITKCDCDIGYQINSTKDACENIPVKSNLQICQDSFGINSNWDGSKNADNTINCGCSIGYEWAIDKKSCIQKVVTANITTPSNPINETTTKPKVNNFKVSTNDIENLKTSGILKKPAAFRECPSTKCSVIKYYAATSKINIIGKYKKGSWYQVVGSTDAKGGAGKSITGWVSSSLTDINKK